MTTWRRPATLGVMLLVAALHAGVVYAAMVAARAPSSRATLDMVASGALAIAVLGVALGYRQRADQPAPVWLIPLALLSLIQASWATSPWMVALRLLIVAASSWTAWVWLQRRRHAQRPDGDAATASGRRAE